MSVKIKYMKYSDELRNALNKLRNRQTILYPTDTVWGLGCDATNEKAVSKIYTIKKRESSKSLVVLVSSLEMLKKYVQNVPSILIDFLGQIRKPTTIIYNSPINLAHNVIAIDNTVAIRIVSSGFSHELIKKFGKPIISSSANISDEPTPLSFSDISKSILDNVDYTVNLETDKISLGSSSIIQLLEDNSIRTIRD